MGILTFDEAAGAPPEALGGKGASLAALARSGVPVPPGLVLTVDLCDRLRRDGFDGALRADLDAALDRALPGDALLAVRSSAPAEDGARDSFAGLLRSFVAVPRGDVHARVLDVLASAGAPRVLAYRRARALGEAAQPCAVVIQRLVDARRSGVLFTANPATGDADEAVLTVAAGLGEGVVADAVDGDTFFADLATGAVRARRIVAKRERIVAAPGGGTRREPVPSAEVEPPALDDAQVSALVALGRALAERAGAPQDLEWAVDGEGRTWVLQARPITALSAGRESVFDSANIVESYPGLTTPLTFSFVRPAYERTFVEAARLLGVPAAVIARERAVFRNLVALVHGRVYYAILNWYRLYTMVPGFERLLPAWEKALGLSSRLVPPAPRPRGLGRLRQAATVGRMVVRGIGLFRSLPRRAEAFLADLEDARREQGRLDLTTLDAHALLDLEDALGERLNGPYAIALVNDLFTFQLFALVERLAARWRLSEDPAGLRDALLCGVAGMESVAPARSAVALAAAARGLPAALSILGSARSDSEAWDALVADAGAAPLVEAMREHVARYGDRTLHELKLETPSLEERPGFLVAMVRNYLAGGQRIAEMEAREREMREAAERTVEERLRGHPLRRALFDRVLARCRLGVALRENLRLARARAYGLAKRNFRELGRRLAREGLLDEPGDLSWLTVDELDGAVRGHAVTRDLRALVRLRRGEWEAHARRPFAPRLSLRGVALAGMDEAAASAPGPGSGGDGPVLRGLGCAPGRARGPVKIVTDPTGDLRVAGEVLVAPTTDPGWVFLMVSAAAVVTERGSPLSHSAIIGRELGIPTVVGVAGATAALSDGEWVEVDGRAGTVTRIAAPDQSGRP